MTVTVSHFELNMALKKGYQVGYQSSFRMIDLLIDEPTDPANR
jgi:hypothetical protein